ncbi:MAG: hypothetical protein CMN87_18710 [Stappia sp.]|uniref:DUF1203 domain-containing protein n=1 Tax=Stappia sp. TaxID=1870903 RepID=UPI000C6AD299|nr:DUF1203 domain-containing protein [Stappia sp.]MAA97504.1 hypothetical protein [Stappia sp.]MBM22037.1 hypothetical protein [Stappia sp.]|tara:strand:+ start:57 stop:530 length:474 start_codon:yes stop_codon:yes gene_type:complete
MTDIRFVALDSDLAAHYRAGAPDANGQAPERRICEEPGLPCRHCLRHIPQGAPYLILALRPFTTLQPYAELGPVFLCADPCERHPDASELPEMFTRGDRYMLRGYSADERIIYGTGDVVEVPEITARARDLLARADVAFVHMRSARNNCYQARIDRA